MNTPNEPESIEEKISKVRHEIMEQANKVTEIRNQHSREIVHLNRLETHLQTLMEEAKKIKP